MESQAKTVMQNSILMSASALIMRGVAVYFSIYLTARVGAEVMGLYSLVNSVWSFALALASAGINLSCTRLAAEFLSKNEFENSKKAVKYTLLVGMSAGLLSAFLVYVSSDLIAAHLLKDMRASLPLKALGLSLPAISMSTALSGYFTAARKAWKGTVSQIAEQFIKISSVTFLIDLMLPRGVEYACLAIILGSAISELSSFLISFLLYITEKKRPESRSGSTVSAGSIVRRVLSVAVPIAISSYIRSGLTSVEHMLIPSGLVKFGLTQSEALKSYGVFSGMVLPVVFFPYAIIYSFTSVVIPEVAASLASGELKRFKYITSRVLRLTLMLGIGIGGILISCSEQFGKVLFDNAEAGYYIRLIAPLLPMMYLDTVTDSILKGAGRQVFTMNVNIVDAALSVILVWLLVPRMGIPGYIAVLYISETVNFSLSIVKLMSISKMKFEPIKWILAPIVSVIASTHICKFVIGSLKINAAIGVAELILAALMTGVVYTVGLVITRAADRELISWLGSTLRLGKRSFNRSS